jgi:hypothetical protein
MKCAASLLIALLVLAGCGGGGGGGDGSGEVLLATIQHDHGGSSSPATLQAAVYVELGPPGSVALITPNLPNGDGGTYTTVAGADVAVDAVFAYLTNGVNESLSRLTHSVPSGLGGGATTLESNMLENQHPALTGDDLVGSTITRIEVDVTKLELEGGPPVFSYALQSVIRIYGTIP